MAGAHPYETKGLMFAITKQGKHVWPFAVGLAITGYLIVSATAGLSKDDLQASKFSNPKQGH
eukprot:CAMPEP_0117672166 /NCGR_PEP_ID=MMETSP0804-20121206/13750_1 /TAXON_ID=1074897 /ORGANISM="Tetraselmis astigmatica, Strain CCMP880" /LENGTH=61 /DNA_ID=CAMNT_0005480731 /DNA_START=113 /DNA_END=298 /DNA_ORIENTATION=+